MEVGRRLGCAVSHVGELKANNSTGSNIDLERLFEYQVEYGRKGKMCAGLGSAVTVDGTMKIEKSRTV